MRLLLLAIVAAAAARAADPAAFLDQLDAADEKTRSAAWQELEGALNAGPPGPVSVNRHAESIRRVWSKLKTRIGNGVATAAATCSQRKDESQELRAQAELVLDLYGSLHGGGPELQAALQLADPRLVFFALRSLARQKLPLPAEAVERVAASDEVRADLHQLLRQQKLPLPAAARSAEALARSQMVRWLLFPTELGCVPDEIVLAKSFKRGKRELFVFRFRNREKKWVAGVSDGAQSFSNFEAWDARTPDEHLEAIGWRK